MNITKVMQCEICFLAKDRTLWLWMAIVFCLSSISIGFGLVEVSRQNATIERLIEADQKERLAESKKLKGWGSAAYYNFHLTYDPPSNFAFAALGKRDEQPWKHRIRMLALEGQIYERDVGNPSVAMVGRFDFSFLVAFVFPLVLIMLLYDIRVSERAAGRHDLLEATVSNAKIFWLSRALLRSIAVFLCLIIPMIIAGLFSETSYKTLILASSIILGYMLLWTFLCYFFSTWRKPGAAILMTLVGIWILTAAVLPASTRLLIDRFIPLPSGAEILMLQRETVNDAWDLPRETTMKDFFDRHPEWSNYEPVQSAFEWPWYYAFQQVGDQETQQLSIAYRNGRLQRDNVAFWTSLLSPPSLLERSLQSLSDTDLSASISYENKVRDFHAALRAFYYPKFFRNEPFDRSGLNNLPRFEPDSK